MELTFETMFPLIVILTVLAGWGWCMLLNYLVNKYLAMDKNKEEKR